MDKKDTLRKIKEFENEAIRLSLELIESEARKVLCSNDSLDEFVMAMGTAFFTDFTGDTLSNLYNDLKREIHGDRIVDFFDMLYDLNENIAGYPMRFTANGLKRTDW